MIDLICTNCKKNYKIQNSRKNTSKYCSRDCKKDYKKAPLEIKTCMTCQKEFTIEKWKLKASHKGTCCSRDCYDKRSPQIEVECICSTKFKAHQSRISYYGRLFCNKVCYQKNGFWGRLTNDIPEVSNYSKFTAKLRCKANYLRWHKQCLERDNNRCISCTEENNLTVHHIFSIYDFVKKHGLNQSAIEEDPLFHDINNGKTLCRKCHLNEHRKEQNEQDYIN